MKTNLCVPNCLEFVLIKRKFHVDKKKIARELKLKDDGIDINAVVLNKFLEQYNLRCSHLSPFLNLETDLILKENLIPEKDVLAAYDGSRIFRTGSQHTKHFSVVISYNILDDLIRLFDPPANQFDVKLISLNNSMQAREDERYGFYVISAFS